MNERKNILFVVFLVLIAIVVYLWYASLTGTPDAGVVRVEDDTYIEVARTVALLENIDFDTTFFDNAEFNALQDFSIPVELVTPRGGSNPFTSF